MGKRPLLRWNEIFALRAGEDALERFERIAGVFEYETGYLRPGKDSTLHDPEEREAAWKQWVEQDWKRRG